MFETFSGALPVVTTPAEACWPSLRDHGRVDTAGLMRFQEWALSRQLLDGIVPEEQLVDRRFVEAAAGASSI